MALVLKKKVINSAILCTLVRHQIGDYFSKFDTWVLGITRNKTAQSVVYGNLFQITPPYLMNRVLGNLALTS